jgi:outer membrane protein TolC
MSTGWHEGGDRDGYNSNSISLSVNWNIFSGFTDIFTRLSNSRELNRTRFDMQRSVSEITYQVDAAIRQVEVNKLKLETSSLYVVASEESYKATQEMFRLGRASLKDTIDARISLQEAQLQLANDKYSVVESFEELHFLAGGDDFEKYVESCGEI